MQGSGAPNGVMASCTAKNVIVAMYSTRSREMSLFKSVRTAAMLIVMLGSKSERKATRTKKDDSVGRFSSEKNKFITKIREPMLHAICTNASILSKRLFFIMHISFIKFRPENKPRDNRFAEAGVCEVRCPAHTTAIITR